MCLVFFYLITYLLTYLLGLCSNQRFVGLILHLMIWIQYQRKAAQCRRKAVNLDFLGLPFHIGGDPWSRLLTVEQLTSGLALR